MDKINQQRKMIDQVDREIIDLLAQRFDAVKQIGEVKKELGVPSLDESRWQMVLDSKMQLAKRYGLSEDMIKEIYEIIHKYALEVEK